MNSTDPHLRPSNLSSRAAMNSNTDNDAFVEEIKALTVDETMLRYQETKEMQPGSPIQQIHENTYASWKIGHSLTEPQVDAIKAFLITTTDLKLWNEKHPANTVTSEPAIGAHEQINRDGNQIELNTEHNHAQQNEPHIEESEGSSNQNSPSTRSRRAA